MKNIKIKFSILALALVFIFSFTAFLAVNFKPAGAKGTVTVDGTSIFTKSGEASILADKQTITNADGKDEDVYYTLLSHGYGEEDGFSFRKHLAYHWFEGEETEQGEDEDKKKEPVNGVPRFFNMEIGFRNTYFTRYIIAFESQQASKTEEGKTVNYLMFFPASETDGVYAVVTDDKDEFKTADDLTAEIRQHVIHRDHIFIRFTEKTANGYNVRIGNPDPEAIDGITCEMKNVGGNYAKYSSSSTTPVYPLILSAEFTETEDSTEEAKKSTAQMILYCLNDQKFKLTSATKHEEDGEVYYTGSQVVDDTPAVLCLNKDISYLSVGSEVKFDYQVIDVLRSSSSPSSQLYYYLLEYEDYDKTKSESFNFNNADLFKEVETDTVLDSDREFYLPVDDDYNKYNFPEGFEVDMALKVYAKIEDYSTNSETSFVYLDWYMDKELRLNIKNNYDSVVYGFIPVAKDGRGVTYNYGGSESEWQAVIDSYAKKVEEASKNLSAGSSSYFYLPSAEELFKDDRTSYRDMKISIYYYSDSQSSSSNLATNNLSLNIPKQGNYTFTLYATDVAGNDMYYLDDDGKKVDFSSSDIWKMYDDEELSKKLPWFSFKVGYTGASFKEVPGKQATAYVGTSYNSASFDINGVDNTYETKYRLFLFDRAGYYNDKGVTFSYDQFIEKMDELFNGENRTYFKEILQVAEGDERYDEFKDYNWNSTTTSFTPQDGNAFYYMRAEVTDKQYNTEPVTCSLAVVASVEAKALKGDSEWLQNNIASIVLLSVAGVSLVAIVLLLVIKPRNKEDIDVQFEKEKNRKKNK